MIETGHFTDDFLCYGYRYYNESILVEVLDDIMSIIFVSPCSETRLKFVQISFSSNNKL